MTAVLQGALAFSLLLSVIFFIQFYFKSHAIRSLQGQMQTYQQTRLRLNGLINESVQYGKRNPEINPILASVGVPVSNPSAKPATR